MDYLRVEHFDQRSDGFMPIMNLQKQLVQFLNLWENLSNWYVRFVKTLLERGICGQNRGLSNFICLLTISKLGAPIAPFFMDKLYRDLTLHLIEKFDSVHLAEFPISVENYVNKMLESKMQKAQTISSLVLSLRKRK
jgi:isoleucyl-tRNA synthetase